MEKKIDWRCHDCQKDTNNKHDYYAVVDALWEVYGIEKGLLCFNCLENRMKRPLRGKDFIFFPINSKNPIVRQLVLEDYFLTGDELDRIVSIFVGAVDRDNSQKMAHLLGEG